MRKAIRNATLGLIAVAIIAGAAYAANEDGIEVLGIEVLEQGTQLVHVSVIAPQGATLWAISDYGSGDVVHMIIPAQNGIEVLAFSFEHPSNRIELVGPNGIEVLDVVYIGGGPEIWELD